MSAALSDNSFKLKKVLEDLRNYFPSIKWNAYLNSNMIRGYYGEIPYEADQTHVLLTFFSCSKTFEASLRGYKVIASAFGMDPVTAITKLEDKINDKQKILTEAVEAITKKGVDNNE